VPPWAKHGGGALGLRQALVAGELVHQRFELSARELGVAGDGFGQSLGPAVAVGSSDDLVEGCVVVGLQTLGLLQRSLEVMRRDLSGDVEQVRCTVVVGMP
jgi:hypothetical protein